MFVKLKQAYFSVGVNNPQGARGVFGPSVTAADLAPYVDADSPIGYIDSITYGREFVLVYTSRDTSFDLFAAVNGAYKGGFADVTVDSTLTWSQKMSRTSVKAFGIGGNAQQGLAAALETSASDLNALKAFVLDGATFTQESQAAPIGYTVKSLTDNRLITLNNMDRYCVVERSVITAPTCVTALAIWNSSNPTPVIPEGYEVVPGDLNAGASGNYIYLMYKTSGSVDGCVRDVGFSNINPAPAAPAGWTLIPSDLNAGAGGNFIWLLYTKGGPKDPVTNFYVSGSTTPPGGYETTVWLSGLVSPPSLAGTPAELNRGAGGANIFLSEQHTAG